MRTSELSTSLLAGLGSTELTLLEVVVTVLSTVVGACVILLDVFGCSVSPKINNKLL